MFFSESRPQIEGDGVFLREPQLSDYAAWADLRASSRAFLEPWEPRWARDELTRDTFRRRIRYYYRDARQDLGYAFFLFRTSDSALIGGITLSNIRRGVSQSCSLGYWIGEPYARQGYMTKGVRAVAWFVFEVLRLHRLEAACLPENKASSALLTRTGFQYEGLARRYLKINGIWQDHWLFALLSDDPLH
jgi:ribosomal-protein-alanine N-acetyltransferase